MSGQPHREDDLGPDEHQSMSRETGGVPDDEAPDQGSTTGTTPSESYVGAAAGQDVGYEGETGAERRAEMDGDNDRETGSG